MTHKRINNDLRDKTMIHQTSINPLLTDAQNAYLTDLRDQTAANDDLHESSLPALPPQPIDIAQVYRVIVGTVATLSAIYCLKATGTLCLHAPAMAINDAPLAGVGCALAYVAVWYEQTALSTFAMLGALACALVI